MFKDISQKKKELLKTFNSKIEIKYIEDKIINGRRTEEEEIDFTSCYANVKELYSTEFYQAFHEGLKDTLVFEVRYFKKLEDLKDDKNRKKAVIYYCNKKYSIFNPDFLNDSREFILIKANRIN